MNETEWLGCTNPWAMVNYLGIAARARKLRLYACACCRTAWADLGGLASSRAVDVAERYADGEPVLEDMLRAGKAADSASGRAERAGRVRPESHLHAAARAAAFGQAFDA